MGENPHFWGIFNVFCPYLKNGSKDFDQILGFNSPQWYLTPGKNRMFVKILVFAVHMYENGIFSVLVVFRPFFALSYIIPVVKD